MEDPSEAAIAEVCEFASLDPVDDRSLVIAALRFREQYTWDETSFIGDRDGLNSSPIPTFNIQGPDDNGMGNTPVIHGVAPGTYHAVPPSRPPSRAQSPLSRMTDWTAEDVARPSSIAQEDKDLERALAESAAMSGLHTPQETGITNDSYNVPMGPELPTNLPLFGPASRDAYDPDQWAMVRRTPEPQEPGPSGRQRVEGAPAFLRSRRTGPDAPTIGALLTILHAIPAARNALLTAGEQPASYGQNSEWWKGGKLEPVGMQAPDQTMKLNTVINIGSDDGNAYEQLSTDSDKARELTDEIHRLMAFLDNTNRAYGTGDQIFDSRLVQECYGLESSQRLFEAFRRLDVPAVRHTFYSDVELMRVMETGESVRSETYAILDIKVDQANSAPCSPCDLYNAMDALYWDDLYRYYPRNERVSVDVANMAAISKIAQVQIMNLNTSEQAIPQGFDVPAIWYADRYLEQNKECAAEIQKDLQKVYDALYRFDDAIEKTCTYWDKSDPENPPVARNRIILSEQAISFAVQKDWHFRANSAWERYMTMRNATKDTDVNTSGHEFDFSVASVNAWQPANADEAATRRELQAEINIHRQKLIAIKKKLGKLNAERSTVSLLVGHLRRKYTVPSAKDDWCPTHKYLLRGVVVSATKFFFCRREGSASRKPKVPEMVEVPKEPVEQLIDMSTEGSSEGPEVQESVLPEGSVDKGKGKEKEVDPDPTPGVPTPEVDQWWMVVYNTHDSASPITVEKTTIDIARAAVSESKKPTLVYARDTILGEDNTALSAALENFMRFDNRFFKQELKEESPRGEKKRQPVEEASPTSPLKRHQRQRSTSIDSMASNMASLGGDSNDGMGGTRGYLGSMDHEMEEAPLLSHHNNERFPLDMDDSMLARGRTRPYSNDDIQQWTLSQQLEQMQHHDYGTEVAGMNMADVLPQREVDTPGVYDMPTPPGLVPEQVPSAVAPADLLLASTKEAEGESDFDPSEFLVDSPPASGAGPAA
ncbi:hypothetical protein SEUCBS139899_003686 [Sporothrix eucalyptigena]